MHAYLQTCVASGKCSATHCYSMLKLKPPSHHLAGNIYLFMCLKKFLAGQHFLNNDDIKEAVKLSSQAAMFYEEEIRKLMPHYDKCLNNSGEYVEK